MHRRNRDSLLIIAVAVIISCLAGAFERVAAAGPGGEQAPHKIDQHRPRLRERASRRREGPTVAEVACSESPHERCIKRRGTDEREDGVRLVRRFPRCAMNPPLLVLSVGQFTQ